MDIQAHFTDIGPAIVAKLDSAQQSIEVAVAWLTRSGPVRGAAESRSVRLALLDDAINRQSGVNLERLRAAGGEVLWIPEAAGGQGSLHHKFCAIDGDGVITGSYNCRKCAYRRDCWGECPKNACSAPRTANRV